MKVTLQALLISLLFLFPIANAQAMDAEMPMLEYGYPDVSVWTTQRDADGQLKNPLLKLAKVMFSEAGLQWNSKPYPAKRLFKYLKEGIVPFSMLVRVPSLQECCLFSEKPVTSTELRIYRRADTSPVSMLEELKGKRVIMIRGYSYGGVGKYIRDATNGIEVQEASSHAAAFQLFERNRGDYVVDYTGPAEEVLTAQASENIAFDVFKQLDVFLVLSRSYPNAQLVMKKLENIAAELDVPRIMSSQ
jgi:ABC-type amino acid transport substrate-binding protein